MVADDIENAEIPSCILVRILFVTTDMRREDVSKRELNPKWRTEYLETLHGFRSLD